MELGSIGRAIEFATQAHAGVFRDGESPLPYITHPIEVLGNLRYIGGVEDEELLTAAILHDVLEWGTCDPNDVVRQFGKKVGGLVQALTRHEIVDEEQLSKSELRRLCHRALMAEIDLMSDEAKAIKLADRLSNLREKMATRSGKKLDRYLAATRDVLDHIDPSVNRALWHEIDRLLQ